MEEEPGHGERRPWLLVSGGRTVPPHLWRQALDTSGKLWRGFCTGTLRFPSGGPRVPKWNLNLALIFTPFLPLCLGPRWVYVTLTVARAIKNRQTKASTWIRHESVRGLRVF